MLYLIIHPECDYEMFNDGNLGSCIEELEKKIVEADSADDAIAKYVEWNEGEVRGKSLTKYFVLQVASKKCEVASISLIGSTVAKEQQARNEASTVRELAELARLKKKFEGK